MSHICRLRKHPGTHLLPQPFDIVGLDINAVQQHPALQWVVEALDEPHHGGLATATLSDKSNGLACSSNSSRSRSERRQKRCRAQAHHTEIQYQVEVGYRSQLAGKTPRVDRQRGLLMV